MNLRPIGLAMLLTAIGAAAAAAPAIEPSSPDNETTALQSPTETHLGIAPNSMGTTTNTGTPAQSAATERRPGSQQPPPNVLKPLGPEPPRERLPRPAPVGSALGAPPAGHTLSGNFQGMSGAVNATQSLPMDPYVGILGTK